VTVDAHNGTLGDLYHIGMVVHDIEAAIERMRRLGVGGWGPVIALEIPGGREGNDGFRVRVSFAQAGPIRFELAEPHGPCPLSDFLAEHGEGVEHFGYRVDDVNAVVERATSIGMKLELSIADRTGAAVAFLSDPALFGVHAEIVRGNPPIDTETWFVS
jgi:catechol 2,3-dioxygenase-like lactoylglutathione lyase family enzyme